MPLTIFLGKLIRLYCIMVALALMARKRTTVTTVNVLVRNPPLLSFAEVLGLAGRAMVPGHNIWSGGALSVVITLVGWQTVIRGAALPALLEEAMLSA